MKWSCDKNPSQPHVQNLVRNSGFAQKCTKHYLVFGNKVPKTMLWKNNWIQFDRDNKCSRSSWGHYQMIWPSEVNPFICQHSINCTLLFTDNTPLSTSPAPPDTPGCSPVHTGGGARSCCGPRAPPGSWRSWALPSPRHRLLPTYKVNINRTWRTVATKKRHF